jgi:hypothetical protein
MAEFRLVSVPDTVIDWELFEPETNVSPVVEFSFSVPLTTESERESDVPDAAESDVLIVPENVYGLFSPVVAVSGAVTEGG